MQIITERDSIKDAITFFIAQYGKGSYGADTRGIRVGEELSKLNKETVSAEEVNTLIGSDWTSKTCNECGVKVKTVMQMGEDLDYDSRTANICLDCLKKAVKLMEQNKE